jgi:hypothetical protein
MTVKMTASYEELALWSARLRLVVSSLLHARLGGSARVEAVLDFVHMAGACGPPARRRRVGVCLRVVVGALARLRQCIRRRP